MHIDAGQLGKYELRERLGQGGMAEVWKAFDARLQRFVAIKFLHSMLRSDPTFISRFLREAQAVASLHHPNIVQIYDFETPAPGNDDALAYMVMDYVEGQTLAEFLRASSRVGQFLPDADLLSLFYSISDAIDYAHRRGLLHRDIKPANILLDQRNVSRNPMGEPILTDFGIVKIMGSSAGTLTNSSMGTPLYISPEQAQGHPDTAASDIYSLGVVLYEVCTGRPPFRGETPFAILQQHMITPPPAPEQFNPAISSELSAVILRSLAKRPEDRYPSALALTTSLAIALGLTLPDRRNLPISSPDIRVLPDAVSPGAARSVEEAPTQIANRQPTPPIVGPRTPTPAAANLQAPVPPVMNPRSPSPEGFVVDQLPTLLPAERNQPQAVTPVPVYAQTPQVSSSGPSAYTQPPPLPALEQPRRPLFRRRGWLIALSVALLVVLLGSGLAVFQALHQSSTTTTTSLVGQAFFISTGTGNGLQNQGLNDKFQINLSHIPAPAAGKQYYAWLLPDVAQAESSVRALGVLQVNGGNAVFSYTDPQHNNLISLFSRFLVTEEVSNPAPISPALDKAAWRYYGEIPQGTFIKDCAGVTVTQLSVLCHMRHLLSGDPDLQKVHLQGGLNFWLLNNVNELVKWAREFVDHSAAVDVRHKIVDILYILNGPACIQQNLQRAAPGTSNMIDDQTLPSIAAIPLLDCSLTPALPGYVTHIDNHLNALLQSPGVSSNQKTLALQVNPELNTVAAWLKELQTDALQLVAMNDIQLTQQNGQNMRSALNNLALEVLSGGTNAAGTQDPGVQTISLQIQDLAKLDVTTYKS
ncbi:MAG TPA: protein kinase [Ktedonobacteraceae bacterium]